MVLFRDVSLGVLGICGVCLASEVADGLILYCYFTNAFTLDGTFVGIWARSVLDVKFYLFLFCMDCATVFTMLSWSWEYPMISTL